MSQSSNKLSQFWQELKRRNVIYFLVGYLTACVAIIELSSNASDTFSISKETVKLLYLLSAIGIPVIILLPWYINRKKIVVNTNTAGDGELNTKLDKPPIQDKSIIVLPFENISSDPEQEYFSDGLTEEIITDLSYIDDLLVISRSSAMTFKGTKQTIKEIAGKVNVRYVLEGSIRKSGNDLRIVAQLIDASTDSHLWAEKYSGTIDNIFQIQENVSQMIADSLKIKLNPTEKKEITNRSIDNMYAYDCYLKASQEIYKFSKEHLNKAIQLLMNGLDIVGENELLYESIGNAYIQYTNFGVSSNENYLCKAQEWVNKLLAINNNSSHGYYLDGMIKWRQGNWKEGIKLLFKSNSINPNNLNSLTYVVYIPSIAGKCDISRKFLPRLLEMDPLTPLFQVFPGWFEYMEGRIDNAYDSFQKMYTMEPENQVYGMLFMHYLTRTHKLDEAFSIIDKQANINSEDNAVKLGLIRKHSIQGEKDKVLKLITPEFSQVIKGDEQYSWELAASFALIDEKNEALNWLENAANRGFINYPFLNEYDPLLENIRRESRFKKLMERVKHEWENFKV